MVLGGQLPGRVGRRRNRSQKRALANGGGPFRARYSAAMADSKPPPRRARTPGNPAASRGGAPKKKWTPKPERAAGPPRTGGPRSGGPRSGAPRTGTPRRTSDPTRRPNASPGLPQRASSYRPADERRSGPPRKPAPRTGGASRSGAAARRDDARSKVFRDDKGPPPRSLKPGYASPRPPAKGDARTKRWGGVARRGADDVTAPGPTHESPRETWVKEGRPRRRSEPNPEPRWERDKPAARKPRDTTKSKFVKRPSNRPRRLPAEVVTEMERAAGSTRRAPGLQRKLGDAARHVERGRDRDAVRVLKALVDEAPTAAAVRELYGQTLYSLGRYRAAAEQIEEFVKLTQSTEQHALLADCYRAMKRWPKVAALWEELRTASPSAEVVAEGRIVAAGALADQGKLGEAIAMLEKAPPPRGKVFERHLRTWFALADLYDRAGEIPKARATFRRVLDADPTFVNVAERLHALG